MIDTEILRRLSETIAARRNAEAKSSYVASLFAKGHDAVTLKLHRICSPKLTRNRTLTLV